MSVMETGTILKSDPDIRISSAQGEMTPGAVSPLIEWVGIGLFALLLGCVLIGLCMVFGQWVPLPLEAICLRG